MRSFFRTFALLAVSASVAFPSMAEAGATGAGSSFVYPVLSRWAADFRKAGGGEINYQSVGSGAGIAQIKAATWTSERRTSR